LKDAGWLRRATLNGLGALATAAVAIIQVVTKFAHGAWIVVLIIPLIIALLQKIHRHYAIFSEEVRYTGHAPLMFLHHTVVVPVNGITKATAGALVYATTISEDVRALVVNVDDAASNKLREEWEAWDIGVDLVILASPYRSILRPIVNYVVGLGIRGDADLVTVVIPEVVPRKWWEHLLHNKTALFIKAAFLFKPNVIVTSVPYLLGHAARVRDMIRHDEFLDTPRQLPEPAEYEAEAQAV
jgi:hypothetical protein